MKLLISLVMALIPISAFSAEYRSLSTFADFIPRKISTGRHTCVLSQQGDIKCWGYNGFGQLGTGDKTFYGQYENTMGGNLPRVDLGNEGQERIKAADLCTGIDFSCAATTSGKVKCWGLNDYSGQLGQGSKVTSVYMMGDQLPFTNLGTNFFVKKIACGEHHACALSDQGTLKCWGNGEYGQLGLGDNVTRGSLASDMGDHLPIISGLVGIQTIATGRYHTCALDVHGVRCWGQGFAGQPGLESGRHVGNTPETIPEKLPYVKLNAESDKATVLSIAAGPASTCAVMTLSADQQTPAPTFAKCWGYNGHGLLGTGEDVNSYGLYTHSMGSFLPRVDIAMDDVIAVYPHQDFSCAMTRRGKLKCWGENESGALGLGDIGDRNRKDDLGKSLPEIDLGLPVLSLSTGMSDHSCAILVNHEVKCWGSGIYGSLGYENNNNLGDQPNQMGETMPFVRLK